MVEILESLKGDSITSLKLTGNQLGDSILKNVCQCFQSLDQLQILEITFNEIGDEALAEIASIFPENKNLREIILNNNKFGNSGSGRNLSTFLEAFLLELKEPLKLDLSCNNIGDVCLEPMIFYLLANHNNAQMTSLNIEYNSFSNFAKRTFAQACLYCPNPDLKVKFGPMSLTQGNLQVAITKQLAEIPGRGGLPPHNSSIVGVYGGNSSK